MGNVTSIASSNSFKVKNLNDFKDGLKGFVGGEFETEMNYFYSDYKRRSKNALIEICADDFSKHLSRKDDDSVDINILEYIQKHILEGEQCTIHHVEYEHPGDMCIYKYIINSNRIEEIEILNQ